MRNPNRRQRRQLRDLRVKREQLGLLAASDMEIRARLPDLVTETSRPYRLTNNRKATAYYLALAERGAL